MAMTAAKLIELLSCIPGDTSVFINDHENFELKDCRFTVQTTVIMDDVGTHELYRDFFTAHQGKQFEIGVVLE